MAENLHFDFASIRNQEENNAVVDYLQSNNFVLPVWLGGYQTSYEDEPADNWTWLDGTDFTYTNWYERLLVNWNNNEECLMLWTRGDGGWIIYDKEVECACLFRDPT